MTKEQKDRSLKAKDPILDELVNNGLFNKSRISEMFNAKLSSGNSRMSFFNKVSGKQEFSDGELVILKQVFKEMVRKLESSIKQSDLKNIQKIKRRKLINSLSDSEIDKLLKNRNNS